MAFVFRPMISIAYGRAPSFGRLLSRGGDRWLCAGRAGVPISDHAAGGAPTGQQARARARRAAVRARGQRSHGADLARARAAHVLRAVLRAAAERGAYAA